MFSWHAIPFVRILVPFIAGIFAALYCPFGSLLPIIILLICGSFFLYFSRTRRINTRYQSDIFIGVFILIIIICFGYLRTYWFNEKRQANYFADVLHPKIIQIDIEDAIVEKEKFFKCYASVKEVVDSLGKKSKVQGTILLYLKKSMDFKRPQIGDRFLIVAKLRPIQSPANPEEFNYQQYLSYHNIYYQVFTDSSSRIGLSGHKNSIYRIAAELRDQSLKVLQKYLNSPQELGVAEALLMGYKDDLDPEITAAFMRTGTLHVLAVSGMHAGIIYLILAFLTAPLTKRKYGKVFQVILLLFGIWLYAFMTGLSSSVLRASVMFSFITIGKLLKYHVNIYNIIYSSAFILLLYDPHFLVDVGFQLSYLAVLGIVFIQPMISKWYTPRFWLSKYVWGLISVSLAAQLLTFPIGIFYFHQFPNYFILSNLLIIPITSLALIGLIALLVFQMLPFLAILLGKALLYLIQFNNWLVKGIDQLPYSYINGLHFDIVQMLMMYGLLFLFLAFCIHKNKAIVLSFLGVSIGFGLYLNSLQYKFSQQKVLLVHEIKGHDVYTCIDGFSAHIIADSSFLMNESKIKFYLEPFLWSHGIKKIFKHDLDESFVVTNLFYMKNSGFQFFDRFLTIDKILKGNVQKNGILVLKNSENNVFENFLKPPKFIKFGANTSFYQMAKFRKAYFKQFKSELKENRYYILISF